MKKILTLLSLLPSVLFAQTFSNSSLTAIPNNMTDLYIPILVQGLPSAIDPTFGIASVCVDISHQHMADLKLKLQSPSGTEILLSDQRGNGGSGYHGVCFREDGSSGYVTSIAAPYTGSYIPQNSLNTFNMGEDPNGVWNLIITDMFNFLDTGFAHSIDITFSVNPPASASTLFICTTSNAGGCFCPDSADQDCDLLPDLTHSWGTNWTNPGTESPGYLYVGTITPNIGWGPLEIHGTNDCYCDAVSVPCTTTLCPNGQAPKQMVSQRVYHKNGTAMTYWDRPAGTMQYHASHGHIHVDDWVWIDLRRKSGDPNPMNWPKTGMGSKQSYCLVNLGDCNNYGACRDNNGNIITQANIPNSSMGSVSGCSSSQGIYVGEYDTYGSILVNLPPTACNGDYYIVSATDPLNFMLESDDNNNWLVAPITLTQQLGTGTFEPEGFLWQVSGAQVNCLSNSFASDSMMWNWGDGTSTTYFNGSPISDHIYTTQGTYIVGEYAYNHCGLTYSQDTIEVFLTTDLNVPVKNVVSWNVYPNPAKDKISIDYTLANVSDVKIEVTDAVGRIIKNMDNLDQLVGKYHVSLNLNTEQMKQGIYFVRLTSNGEVLNQRFIVLK